MKDSLACSLDGFWRAFDKCQKIRPNASFHLSLDLNLHTSVYVITFTIKFSLQFQMAKLFFTML